MKRPLFNLFLLTNLGLAASPAWATVGTCTAICESAQILKSEVDYREECQAGNRSLQPVVARYCPGEHVEYVFVPGYGAYDFNTYTHGSCRHVANDEGCGDGVLNCAVTQLGDCTKQIQNWPGIRCFPSPYLAFYPGQGC